MRKLATLKLVTIRLFFLLIKPAKVKTKKAIIRLAILCNSYVTPRKIVELFSPVIVRDSNAFLQTKRSTQCDYVVVGLHSSLI